MKNTMKAPDKFEDAVFITKKDLVECAVILAAIGIAFLLTGI
jgi:hypothetical protein